MPVRQRIKDFHSQDGTHTVVGIRLPLKMQRPGRRTAKKFNGPQGGGEAKRSGGLQAVEGELAVRPGGSQGQAGEDRCRRG